MALKIDWENSEMRERFRKLVDGRFKASFLGYAKEMAGKYDGELRVSRPWTDQTGRAKESLSAVASYPDDQTIRITFSIGVDYGIWLELAHEKKYAVIAPTLHRVAPEYLEGASAILRAVIEGS